MHRPVSVMLLTVVVTISTFYIHAAPQEDTIHEQDVKQLLANWTRAFATKDTTLLASVLDDSWVYSGGAEGNTSTKTDSINELKNADYTISQVDFSDLDIRYYQDIAVITGQEKLHIKGADGAVSYVDLRFTDVYQKRDGRTRAISTHSSPIAIPKGSE